MTTHKDIVYHMGGVPVHSSVFHTGRPFFVKPYSGNDGNDGRTPDRAMKTLAAAQSRAEADKDQCVYLIAESNTAANTTDYQSATLDWAKDGVHLVGVNCGAMIGSRSRIGQLSTVKTVETLFKLSADNCLIANIEVFQGVDSSTATSPVAFEVTGQRNRIVNCQLSGNGDTGGSTDTAGARSLLLNGAAENIFQHCYIGLDTVTCTTMAAQIEHKSSAKRNVLENCIISTFAGAAGHVFVKADAASSAIDRTEYYRNCLFVNPINSTATTMTAAIVPHASLSGTIFIVGADSGILGATDVTAGDSAKVKILGPTGAANASNEHLEMLLAKSVDVA